MYLSYSGYKKYLECPLAYYHAYIARTILPKPEDRINMLYGSVVGELNEAFYNEYLWKQPDPAAILSQRAPSVLQKVMEKEAGPKKNRCVFKWSSHRDYKSPGAVLEEVRTAIPRALQTIRHHRLLGVDARAEVKLDRMIAGHTLGGRADVILTRPSPHGDRVIYDGKGSKYRDQYVDVRQLYWYAMLDEVQTGRLPDQVAFVFWRSDPETAVDWHPVTKESVAELKDNVLTAISQIEKDVKRSLEAFEARPSQSKCKLCPYSFTCTAGKIMLSSPDSSTASSTMGVEEV